MSDRSHVQSLPGFPYLFLLVIVTRNTSIDFESSLQYTIYILNPFVIICTVYQTVTNTIYIFGVYIYVFFSRYNVMYFENIYINNTCIRL